MEPDHGADVGRGGRTATISVEDSGVYSIVVGDVDADTKGAEDEEEREPVEN